MTGWWAVIAELGGGLLGSALFFTWLYGASWWTPDHLNAFVVAGALSALVYCLISTNHPDFSE